MFNKFKELKFELIKSIIINWWYVLIKNINIILEMNKFMINFFNYLILLMMVMQNMQYI